METTKTSIRRQTRVRVKIRKKAGERFRLSVYRSNKNIYAQLIDDSKGITLACASSLDKDIKSLSNATCEVSKKVGILVAERAAQKGLYKVSFDRGRFSYHGQVKALAQGAREAGLSF